MSRQSDVDDDDDEYMNIFRRHVVQHTSDADRERHNKAVQVMTTRMTKLVTYLVK